MYFEPFFRFFLSFFSRLLLLLRTSHICIVYELSSNVTPTSNHTYAWICCSCLTIISSHIHTHGTACILLHMCIGVWAAFNGTNCSDFDHSTALGDVERRYTQPTIIHTYMRHKHHENAHCTNETRYILKSHICQCHAYQMSLETCTCLSGIYECICNCTYDTPFHTHTKNSVSDRSIPFSEFNVCFGFNWVRAKKNRRKKIKVKVIAFSLFLRVFTCVCVLASLDDHVARLNHLAHVLRGNCSQDKSRRTYARSID